jgi:hypothetical protein
MRKRKQDQAKLEETVGLADLGVIDEQEFERRWSAAGGSFVDMRLEDASDEHLIAVFNAPTATDGHKAYIASLLVARGLTACGCEHCQKLEAYAKRWNAFIRKYNSQKKEG